MIIVIKKSEHGFKIKPAWLLRGKSDSGKRLDTFVLFGVMISIVNSKLAENWTSNIKFEEYWKYK